MNTLLSNSRGTGVMPSVGCSVDIGGCSFTSSFGRDEPKPILARCAKLLCWLHCSSVYYRKEERMQRVDRRCADGSLICNNSNKEKNERCGVGGCGAAFLILIPT